MVTNNDMLIKKEIRDTLRDVKETELHHILAQLFEAMDFKDVKVTHGTQEFGKDLVFYEENKFGDKIWHSCVVKKGDVNQSVYSDIIRQIDESRLKPFDHHQYGKVKISHVFVVASGVYKENTKALITEKIINGESFIKYFDNSNIADLIEKLDLKFLFENPEIESVSQAAYKAFVLQNMSDTNGIKFLEADFGVPIDAIDDFKINIRAKSKALFEERKNYVDDKEHSFNLKLLPEILEIAVSKKPYILHGIATSGKSTILKKLGKDFLKIRQNARLFFFDLNKVAKDELFALKNVLDDSYKEISNETFNWSSNDPILILLDGLDEVSNDKIRTAIINQVLEIKQLYSCQVILTSRTTDFLVTSNDVNSHFEKFELLPLNYNEMVQIGNKILADPAQAKKFVHLVQNSELLKSFPKTPLTTILLAILLKEEQINIKELPKNLSELYSKFVDLFLNKWDKGKGISEQYQLVEKEYVLKCLAEELHKTNRISFTEDEMLIFLTNLKKDRPIDLLKDPKQFIQSICERSSILVKDKSDGSFRFFHLTIQEYLTASNLTVEDEDLLVEEFLNDWWLNTNIFFAGKFADNSNVLKRIGSYEIVPVDFDDKLKYLINSSKVLKAVHLWDYQSRKTTLIAMMKIFDGLINDVANAFVGSDIVTIKTKTLLDIVLWARSFFVEFLDSDQFIDSFKSIWSDINIHPELYNDILRYCIAYNLCLKEHTSTYLEEFISNDKTLNPRWFKIAYVDINVKKFKVNDKKLLMKFKNKAYLNKAYIQKQFQDRLYLHYQSITGITPYKQEDLQDDRK